MVTQKFSIEGNSANFDQDTKFNSLNAELNPICYLLALLGARNILRASSVRVNLGKIRCESTDWITCLKLRLQFTYIIRYKDKSFGLQKKNRCPFQDVNTRNL